MPPTLLVLDEASRSGAMPAGAMSALDYIKGGGADLPPGTLVRNIAADYAYLSRAYYVSLLAEARGHAPFPRAVDLLSRQGGGGRVSFSPKRLAQRGSRTALPLGRRERSRSARLGVLFTPADKFGASSEASLREFARSAAACGMEAELFDGSQIDNALDSLSGLFIRDLTQPGNHAFQAARKAEELGIPVIDDPTSIVRCENKVFIHHLLERHGVSTPRTILVTPDVGIEAIVRELGLPVVLKTPDGAFSIGVHKARTAAEGARLLTRLRARSAVLVAQEYMPTNYDWRIGMLGGEPLFACKYYMARGHWQIIRHLSPENRIEGEAATVPLQDVPADVIDNARRAARLAGDGLYGVDIKQQGAQTCVIEVNANPDIDSECEAALPASRVWSRLAEWFVQRARGERCDTALPHQPRRAGAA